MTKNTRGLAVVQEGADFGTAPDWQHVFDTRWRFMEVHDTFDMQVTVPAASGQSNNYWQKVEVFRHDLDFFPAFHGLRVFVSGDDSNLHKADIYITDTRVLMARDVYEDMGEIVYNIKGIIYNLPILEEYEAPVGPLNSYNNRPGKVGLRMLDDNRKDVRITDHDALGFSADTTKRVLSVHSTGVRWINEYVQQRLTLESVDTSTDVFTYTRNNESDGVSYEWVETGAAVRTDGFGTYPSPLESDTVYYIIYINDSELQLAATESDANNGNQIDITDTDGLPDNISRELSTSEKEEQSKVIHGVGYPPSFHIAEIQRDYNGVKMLASIKDISFGSFVPVFQATDDTISMHGIFSVYSEEIGFIIFKDPIEVAQ